MPSLLDPTGEERGGSQSPGEQQVTVSGCFESDVLGQLHGHTASAVTQSPELRRARCLVLISVTAILKFYLGISVL